MHVLVGQTFQMNQLINIKQGVEFTGVCRSSIYEMMDEFSPYYDPTYPKKVTITTKLIGWSAWEINQWIEDKRASQWEQELHFF
ncbi:AlpA family transcriptional regulator [Acinetobacter calcoaceticus]|uniref:AlpA family transcriptional regulator n=1 Tax=Acinetobacter calcoaceticus TaxID=471 RepID=A0A4R1XY25_ACICA|nr:AlpA family transcriptional regulator [Acinetobacter calcoaceticus]